MAVTINFNGIEYVIPNTGDTGWGDAVESFLVAIPSGTLQPNTTTFTLTAGDLSFGSSYGIKVKSLTSLTANPAASGILRLANADGITWRNGTNSADNTLGVNSSNQLLFNGSPVISSGGSTWGLIVGTLSNQTDLQSALNSVVAVALKSASTSVSVSAATAPSAGQVLTATNSTTATWQTPLSGHVIQDEGSPLTQRAKLNFVGGTVTVTDGGAGPDSTIITLATWVEDHFTANGSDAFVTLTHTPKETANVSAYINGIFRQYTTDYTISGTTLTFTFTPNSGDLVSVKYQY